MKADEERTANEKVEDVAILSMFPKKDDSKFTCYQGKECLVGDPRKVDSGDDR